MHLRRRCTIDPHFALAAEEQPTCAAVASKRGKGVKKQRRQKLCPPWAFVLGFAALAPARNAVRGFCATFATKSSRCFCVVVAKQTPPSLRATSPNLGEEYLTPLVVGIFFNTQEKGGMVLHWCWENGKVLFESCKTFAIFVTGLRNTQFLLMAFRLLAL